jgi:hypothetical protein
MLRKLRCQRQIGELGGGGGGAYLSFWTTDVMSLSAC